MLADNPIAKFEFEALQRTLGTKRAGYWLRLFFYFCILLVATIPLFIYIREEQLFLLVFMLIIIFSAQLILTLSTLAQAIEPTLLQRQNGMWDVLVLTGMRTRNVIMSKSAAVVRGMWAEWFMIALARLGVALGFAHYLHAMHTVANCYDYFPNSFCYASWAEANLYPSPLAVLIAFLALMLMTRLELRLISLIGICASLLPSKTQVVSWAVAVVLWLTVITGASLGVGALDRVQNFLWQELWCSTGSYCQQVRVITPGTGLIGRLYLELASFKIEFMRLTEVSQVGISAFMDGGTLLAAHIMRPQPVGFLAVLLRGIVCAITAAIGYHLLNWLLLLLAQRLAVAQSALPEAHKRIKINKLYWLKRITGFA